MHSIAFESILRGMRAWLPERSADAAIAAAGSKVTYTGTGVAAGSWALSSEFGVLCGVVLGVAGFIVNWYFKRRDDKRKQRMADRAEKLAQRMAEREDRRRDREDQRREAEHAARMREIGA